MAYLVYQPPDFFDVIAFAAVLLNNALLLFATYRFFTGKFFTRAVKGSALSAFAAAVFMVSCAAMRILVHTVILPAKVVVIVILAFGLAVGFAVLFMLNFLFIQLVDDVMRRLARGKSYRSYLL
ncbi:hypothetical protein SAMN02745218_01226 [Desulfofundulus australicus DSM 11792]|uniref:Uncharacterized protein n=1 Tax=Desulfofundulus australicus DSM 11792 TaxID=1121425 RepID=A0A1M4XZM7_9FIRM|nr:hypothetical protein [Desulfofundulus australicus]SHE98889.1 hypothetical protein SAMN02745218_01226 [Desulfofundulus australicus DSM 11792]